MVNENLEQRIVEEILGVKYGGMYGGDAFCDFRENFFDKIEASDKTLAVDILMALLKNKSRDPDIISRVAWICADLDIPNAADEIKKLSEDKRFKGTIYSNAVKAVLDQLEIENQLIAEIGRLKDASDKRARLAIYDQAITAYRKLRGDTSRIYASKDIYEKSEAGLSRTVVSNALKKILRSDRYSADLKAKVAALLSDNRKI